LLLAIKQIAKLSFLIAVLACAKEQTSSQAGGMVDTSRPQVGPAVDTSPPSAGVVDSSTGTKPSVRLVDAETNGIETEPVEKVEVKLASTVDTIPKLLTSLMPVVTNDGKLHGIGMTDVGIASDGFDYDPQTKRLTRFPLPADLNGSFHEIEINADARFVAYIAHTVAGGTWAVIRSWPSLKEVMRSATSEGYPSDVSYDQVKWLDPNRFQISYRIGSGAIVSIAGDVATKAMKVDTAAASAPQQMPPR
jgi:hypothetical protein